MTNTKREPLDTLFAFKTIALTDALSGTEKRVTATIVDSHNHKTEQCDPSLNRIAHLLKLNRRTVIRAIKQIEHQQFLRKERYGGRFHRNSYEPNWLLYRELERTWAMRKKTKHWVVSNDSSSQSQARHPSDVEADTQTYPINQSNEPVAHDSFCIGDDAMPSSHKPARKEKTRTIIRRKGPTRFRIAIRPRDAAAAAAERRWNRALHQHFSSSPEVYGEAIGAIDALMQCAATAAEMKRQGAGIIYLLEQLRALGIQKPSRRRGD